MRKRRSIKKPWLEKNGGKISLLILLFGFVYFILFYPYFSLRESKISLIRAFNLSTLVKRNHPEIYEAKVSWSWPNKINLKPSYRQPIGSACFPQCYLIDQKGVIYQEGEKEPRIHISRYQPVIGHRLPWPPAIFSRLYYEGFTDILIDDGFLRAEHKKQWRAFFTIDNLETQIQKMNIALSEMGDDNLDYIDLRYAKIYLKRK